MSLRRHCHITGYKVYIVGLKAFGNTAWKYILRDSGVFALLATNNYYLWSWGGVILGSREVGRSPTEGRRHDRKWEDVPLRGGVMVGSGKKSH